MASNSGDQHDLPGKIICPAGSGIQAISHSKEKRNEYTSISFHSLVLVDHVIDRMCQYGK
jgi:hypothetical protein